jgi:hypothetical protein
MRNDYREIAYKAGLLKNWDDFRAVYNDLTIKDLVSINTAWDIKLPEQNHSSVGLYRKMFEMIELDELRVVELGCHRGNLARKVLESTTRKIKDWTGYDVNHKAVAVANRISEPPFHGVKLNQWFWEVWLSGFNVFVSAHTLEHFNKGQVFKILERVATCNYLLLEIPFRKSWDGYRGSHVLDASEEEIARFLAPMYKCIFEAGGLHKSRVTAWRKR